MTDVELDNQIQQEMLLDSQPARQVTASQSADSEMDLLLDKEIEDEIRHERFGTTGEKAKGFVEAMGRGFLSSPVMTGIEKHLLGIPAENIAARKEELGPGGELIAEGVGLVAPSLLSGGLSALAKAGTIPLGVAQKAALASKYSQSGLLNMAGQVAAKKAVTDSGKKALALGLEGALFATGDEIGKEMLRDSPGKTMENVSAAAINVGAQALFGAALGYGIGKVTPLWKEKFGTVADEALRDVDRQVIHDPNDLIKAVDGVISESEIAATKRGLADKKANYKEITEAGERLGAPVPEGMTSNSKTVQKIDSSLTKSPSIPGELRNRLYQKGFDAVDNALTGVLKTDGMEEISKAEIGSFVADSLDKKIRVTKDIVSSLYNTVAKETQHIPVDKNLVKSFTDKLMSSVRVSANKSSDTYRFARGLTRDLLDIDTLEGLKAIIDNVSIRTGNNYALKTFGYEIKDLLNNTFEKSLVNYAGQMLVPKPQARMAINGLLTQLDDANKLYGPFRNKIRKMAIGLGFRKTAGPADFLVQLREAKPELLVNRISAKENARFVEFIAREFPEEFNAISSFNKMELLKGASKRDKLKATTLVDKILGLPKELRNVTFTKEQLQKVKDAKTWLNNLPENVNISNTSQGIQFNEYWQNPMKSALITGSDIGKLAMLKVLSSGERPSAAGLKVMGDFFTSAHAGLTLIGNAATDVFLDKNPLPASKTPSDKSLSKLDLDALDLQRNPEAMLRSSEDLGHYLKDGPMAVATTMSRVSGYLNSVRPKARVNSVLGRVTEPSAAQMASYRRTLEIAEQPLIIMKKIQQGTLLSSDIKDLSAMYPEVRNVFVAKLTKELINRQADGKPIPFKIRKSLSMLAGMPLDLSFAPQSIQAAQAVFQPNQQPQQAGLPQMAKKNSRMSKLPSLTETDQQRRSLKK